MKRLVLILVMTTLGVASAAMVSDATKNHKMAMDARTDAHHHIDIALPYNLKKLPVEQLLPLP